MSVGVTLGLDVVYVETSAHEHGTLKRPGVGAVRGIVETAMGCAWLAQLTAADRNRFLARARSRFGHGRRVSAFFVCAYMSVRILAEAIRETGSELPEAILPFISSRSFASPMGDLTISAQTRHTAFAPLLARIAEGNIFSVVERASLPVDPDPYLADYQGLRPIGATAIGRPPLRVVGS